MKQSSHNIYFTPQLPAGFYSKGVVDICFPSLNFRPKETYLKKIGKCKEKLVGLVWNIDYSTYINGPCEIALYRKSDDKELARFKGNFKLYSKRPTGKGKLVISTEYQGFKKIIYEGEWKEKKKRRKPTEYYFEGTVELHYSNGAKYYGMLSNNSNDFLYHGTGKLIAKDDSIFEGQWYNGGLNQGTITCNNEEYKQVEVYESIGCSKKRRSKRKHSKSCQKQFTVCEGGAIHGVSAAVKAIYRDGREYDGDLNANGPTGRGQLKFPDGTAYNGNFSNGKYEGKGELVLADGNIYKGNFSAGNFNGSGKMEYANGDVYSGDWKNGYMNGRGWLKYSDGGLYMGQFEDGLRHGEGYFRLPNNQRFNVVMEKDELVSMKPYKRSSRRGYMSASDQIMAGLKELWRIGSIGYGIYNSSPAVKRFVDDGIEYVKNHSTTSSRNQPDKIEKPKKPNVEKIKLIEENHKHKKYKVSCRNGHWYIVRYIKEKKKFYSLGNWSWFSDTFNSIEKAAEYRCR